MNKAQRLLSQASGVALGLAAPAITFAATNPFSISNNLLTQTQNSAGLGSNNQSLPDIIGTLINVVLGFLGIVLLFYVLRAGFLWMTAGGDEKQVKTAKDMIRDAIIGLVVIVAGFAISNFVLNQLLAVTNTI